MIADVRVRICMPYRSAGVRPWRVHSVEAGQSAAAGGGKFNKCASRQREESWRLRGACPLLGGMNGLRVVAVKFPLS